MAQVVTVNQGTKTNKESMGSGGHMPFGEALLHDPRLNKGSAFTEEERDALGLHGLLPPAVFSIEEQVALVMEQFGHKPSDIEKYIYLTALHDRNETLFYRVLVDHIEEMMPIVYTPTVGQACQLYGHIMRQPQGMYLSIKDRGRLASILENAPGRNVKVIVVTDGERILGLGDQGANGMGIPVGKLTLYTACAGIHPDLTLPICLDVGTENEELLADPLYIGLRQRRERGEAYDAFVGEFMEAARQRWPDALVQFEDFANLNAFRLLAQYQERACCFNDDIQGTAAVALAGVYSALHVTGASLAEQRFLFQGAGEAGTGIGHLLARAMVEEGLDEDEARRRCWFVDSKGLVVKSRTDLREHKQPFAHEHEPLPDFLSAVEALKPTAIIGVSGQAGAFNEEVLTTMAGMHERPIVFALSNPTSKAECTAEQAYRCTEGRALFASGSPFAPVMLEGKALVPGQGNNAYIFPGMGLGITSCGIKRIPDELFLAAAKALAAEVSAERLGMGCLYPPLNEIRRVSLSIAAVVAEKAYELGLATEVRPLDFRAHLAAAMYDPAYRG